MKEYWDLMKLRSWQESSVQKRKGATAVKDTAANGIESDRRYEAYKRAHEIRQFEIGLFWQRATYYWAFILASFTVHFALLGRLFSTFNAKEDVCFSLESLCEMPGLSLFALAMTSFFCYFFCLCWVLMNKGSKFWQQNWEEHIDMLQEEFSGNLYKTILNTENKDFSKSVLSRKAYDYSVSKITMLTSICLMVAALLLFGFYSFIICQALISDVCCAIVLTIVILLIVLGFSWFICYKATGNKFENKKKDEKWISRDEPHPA